MYFTQYKYLVSDIFCASLHIFFSEFLFPYIASAAPLAFYSCPRGSHLMPIEDCFQLLSYVWIFMTPWTAVHQASLSFTISRSLLKLMFVESVKLSNHLILCPFSCCLQSFPASGSFPMSQVFSFASGGQSIGASTSASVLPMNIQGNHLGLAELISSLSKGLSRVFSSTIVQFESINSSMFSFLYGPTQSSCVVGRLFTV